MRILVWIEYTKKKKKIRRKSEIWNLIEKHVHKHFILFICFFFDSLYFLFTLNSLSNPSYTHVCISDSKWKIIRFMKFSFDMLKNQRQNRKKKISFSVFSEEKKEKEKKSCTTQHSTSLIFFVHFCRFSHHFRTIYLNVRRLWIECQFKNKICNIQFDFISFYWIR